MEQLKKFLVDCPPKWRGRRIRENPHYVALLENAYPGVNLLIQIDSLVHSVSPFCVVCSAPVKTVRKQTCSTKCRGIYGKQFAGSKLQKTKATMMSRYGVVNARNIPGATEKIHQSMIQKYGALVSPTALEKIKNRTTNLQAAGRATLLKKYGVTNAGQLPDHVEKCKETLVKNYGVDNYFKSEEFIIESEVKRHAKWEQFVPPSITIADIRDADENKSVMFSSPNRIIEFDCASCGGHEALPSETVRWRIQHTGTCCGKCANLTKGSNMENEVRTFVQSLGHITVDNSRNILPNKEIDIYVPSLRIGFEFHGLFWHNDMRVDKKYHLDKLQSAEANGITLIQIFEDEWVHLSHIVKSRIQYILGKTQTVLPARKCTVRNIRATEARDFLIENHLQGAANSSIKIGLYYNDTLVSVMTFARPSLAKGSKHSAHSWELSRFCNKLNLTVVGGAGKLFSYFVKTCSPTHVYSYADRRWSSGKLYNAMGFNWTANTRINYWYVDHKNTQRIHRFALRKNINDDNALTEAENRLAQGFVRIWDCGSSKWEWHQH